MPPTPPGTPGSPGTPGLASGTPGPLAPAIERVFREEYGRAVTVLVRVHSDAPTAAATDWRQILQLYDQLLSLTPTTVVALHRAVAVAEVEGPRAALAIVEDLGLDGYYLFHAVRADLLGRLGREPEAVLAYDAAIGRTGNAAERDFLRRSRQVLTT